MNKKVFDRIAASSTVVVPTNWLQIKTIDMHTGGEPLRVIVDGFPELRGNSVLEYRRDCQTHHDNLRTGLMFEPRGHADMYGCLLVPPNDSGADFGVIFMHNEGYSTMCGHAIIAISKLAVEMQWIDAKEGDNTVRIDAPCGRITSFVKVVDGEVESVRFHCVPSFVVELDRVVDVSGLGSVTYDLAYGGAYYAYVDLQKNDLDVELNSTSYQRLVQFGRAIKAAVQQCEKITHPFEEDLGFLYGTIFIGPPSTIGVDSRNVCVFADGEVDRSPTGSGVSGRMAIHFARQEVAVNEELRVESISNSVFTGSVVSEIEYGPYQAVIPQVSGTAYVTGVQTFLFDPNDPMRDGFLLR